MRGQAPFLELTSSSMTYASYTLVLDTTMSYERFLAWTCDMHQLLTVNALRSAGRI